MSANTVSPYATILPDTSRSNPVAVQNSRQEAKEDRQRQKTKSSLSRSIIIAVSLRVLSRTRLRVSQVQFHRAPRKNATEEAPEDGRRNGRAYTRSVRITRTITPRRYGSARRAACRPFYDRTFIRHFEPLNVRRGISSLIYRDANARLSSRLLPRAFYSTPPSFPVLYVCGLP